MPQFPLQPSLPQLFPEQLGVQDATQLPLELHVEPDAHEPQLPLQPSLPQFLPEQFGVQVPDVHDPMYCQN